MVLADPDAVEDLDRMTRACTSLGAELHVTPLAQPAHPDRHDALRLAAAYRDILA